MDTNDVARDALRMRMTRANLVRRSAALALGSGLFLRQLGSPSMAWARPEVMLPSAASGTLRLAMGDGSPEDKFDPTIQVTDFESVSIAMMYDLLVELDNGFLPHPGLATSWEHSNDLKTWTIHLRPGVEFHDGSPLTAADVVYSIQRNIDPKGTSVVASILGPVLQAPNVVALDSKTVRLGLSAPYAFVPNALGNRFLRIVKNGTTDFSQPVGTGPFKYTPGSFVPGQAVAVERNPNYWKSGQPILDAITISNIVDPSTHMEALLTGQVDVISNIDYGLIPTVNKSTDHTLLLLQDAFWTPLALNIHEKPFNDHRVIQAIRLAIDRPEIVRTVFNGAASVAYDVPVPKSDPAFDKSLGRATRDLAEAKTLLREAGYKNGVSHQLVASPILGSILNLAVAISAQAAEAGIHLKVKQWPAATFWNQVFLKNPAYATYWSRRTVADTFSIALATKGAWNETHFSNKTFDKTLAKAKGLADFQKQLPLYHQLEHIAYDKSSYVIPTYAHAVWARSKNVQGVQMSQTSFVDFREASIV